MSEEKMEWRKIWKESIIECQKAILSNDQKGKIFKSLKEKYNDDKMVLFEEGISYECLKQYDKAVELYEQVSSKENGLPVAHWRSRANIFLQRAKNKKSKCPILGDLEEDCKPHVIWNAFYYLHSYVYIPKHIRYMSISSIARVGSEPEMSIVIFRTCFEEILRFVYPEEYKQNDKNNGGLKTLWGSLNDKTPLFIGEDGIKEWGSEIIKRGNAAAHGNSHGKEIDYNNAYIEKSIIYFLKFMKKANDIIRKDSILKDQIKKSLGLE